MDTSTQKLPNPNDNEGPSLIRTVWALLGVSGAIVCARLYTKARKTRRLYWDDGLIVLAWLFGLVHAIQIQSAVHHGLGRHMMYMDESQRENAFRLGAWSLLAGYMSPMCGRIAFCVTVLFLAGTDARVKQWPIYLFVAGQLVVNIAAAIIFYSQCGSHVTYIWTSTGSLEAAARFLAHCEDPVVQTDFGYFQGSFNTLTDAFLTLIPAILIEHTKLSLKNKIGLGLLLCLSVNAMIASIVKTYEARALSMVLDYSYDLCPFVIWISVELNTVIVVSSLPFLRKLFVRDRQHRAEQQQQQISKWDVSSFSSYLSKRGARANLTRVGSEEEIMPQPPVPMQSMDNKGIQVTREVTVSYQSASQHAFVHAALVGLIQGELDHPQLARR
ncbi:hypothetical protein LTR53_012936 [Teratosphaeriaceae sp. CCFEE 6253]|nr:hypothetical protein LTR53_012936 [Teratosphaeriaceae sp. CCFEE 6253]